MSHNTLEDEGSCGLLSEFGTFRRQSYLSIGLTKWTIGSIVGQHDIPVGCRYHPLEVDPGEQEMAHARGMLQ
jgi:hypothetical protein